MLISPALLLLLSACAAHVDPMFKVQQQATEAQGIESFDGHQVWRLHWNDMDQHSIQQLNSFLMSQPLDFDVWVQNPREGYMDILAAHTSAPQIHRRPPTP